MTADTQPTDSTDKPDYDSPWKEALERFFSEFLALPFPAIYEQIDWSVPPEFLDKELQQIGGNSPRGRRQADKLVKVRAKAGGTLRLAVPDFAACAKLYHERGLADGLNGLIGLICGGQRDGMDYHKMIFDEPFLKHELLGLGFKNIRRWDWRETEHAQVDDYSQSYLPHLDREQGTLMSLNLEATR